MRIISQIIFFIIFWAITLLLRNETIYQSTLNKISHNYKYTSSGIESSNEPYKKISNLNIIEYDAESYLFIKDHGYDFSKLPSDYIFGFFPLFPYIWKISLLPPKAIPFLNFLFFLAGLWLLGKIIPESENKMRDWALATLPGIIVFIVPYSEAVFFITIALAMYGFAKNNYKLYFAGMMLASMTRPVAVLMLASIIFTEIILLIQHKEFSSRLKSLFRNSIPVITGTLIVSLIQLLYKSGGLLKFVEVQKYWEHSLMIPRSITDWSKEGFGMNLATVFMIGIPLLVLLALGIFKRNEKEETNPLSYLSLFSIVFLSGNFLFIFLFQHGNLHSLFRYIISSPFLYLLLLILDVKKTKLSLRMFAFAICFMSGLLVLLKNNYSSELDFTQTGFLLVYASMGLWLFHDKINRKIFVALIAIVLFANAVWTSYLFNNYISEGWLFL